MLALAKFSEIDEIMSFIDREWRKGHVLARNRRLFEWMYVKNKDVHFVISRNDHTNDRAIDGILGFIPYDGRNSQISLTVWRALKSENTMIGISMLSFLEKTLSPTIIASPGINPTTTTALYKYFRYEVGKMHHYYRLADLDNFYIPVIQEKQIHSSCSGKNDKIQKLQKLQNYEDFLKSRIIFADNSIKKDGWYIKRRYFEHPVFQYIHYLVEDKLDIILREQEVDGHKCLRIVDMLGDYNMLAKFTAELDKILASNGYEYVDCYVANMSKTIWEQAGWIDVEETSNIIPNYFSPFERKNVDMYYSCKPHGVVIFRGDGDQDRPN